MDILGDAQLITVTRDFIECFTFANMDGTTTQASCCDFFSPVATERCEAECVTKHWVQGDSVLSVQTSTFGLVKIMIRRPCGTTRWVMRLENEFLPPNVTLPLRLSKGRCITRQRTVGPTPSAVSTGARNHEQRGEKSVVNPTKLFTGASSAPALSRPAVHSHISQTEAAGPILHHGTSGSETPQVLDPAFLFLQLRGIASAMPTPLQPSEMLNRALSVLDRTPCVHTHKIGIIYVGAGQKSEAEILANQDGSPKFVTLLMSLGEFVRLEDCRANGYYSGGLDCETGSDGEFGLLWKDDGCHVMFHVAVMMPTQVIESDVPDMEGVDVQCQGSLAGSTSKPAKANLQNVRRRRSHTAGGRLSGRGRGEAADDANAGRIGVTQATGKDIRATMGKDAVAQGKQSAAAHGAGVVAKELHRQTAKQSICVLNLHNKKRHIGNDYVHIVYSDNEDAASYPYRQDTIAGQFNFVHIVVRPMGEQYFSVDVKVKQELHEVGVVPSFQVVHADVLRNVVRELALRADVACRVFHECIDGEFQSNQLERLKQIRRIVTRLG